MKVLTQDLIDSLIYSSSRPDPPLWLADLELSFRGIAGSLMRGTRGIRVKMYFPGGRPQNSFHWYVGQLFRLGEKELDRRGW